MYINNSTIAENESSFQGGGILSYGTTSINNATIVNNRTYQDGGGIYQSGSSATFTIKNTIVASNTAQSADDDCAGLVISEGYNLIENISGCIIAPKTGDQFNVDPVFGAFVEEGGYYPLLNNSPAIDAGSPLTPGTPDSTACLVTDQRGITRPQRSQCDIGAYELEFGSFYDVSKTFWAWRHIEAIYTAGITGGCSANPLNYCPAKQVTRAEMAIFLEVGMNGSDFTPPDASGTVFNDVPADHWAAKWIEQLAADGITGGCGNGNYCPNTPINREQMAVFLLLAKHGPGYVPPDVEGDSGFNDVPADYWAAPWIKQLAAEGITGGCGGGNFCPKQLVTRDQMAVFLQITFGLPLP